jgi:hypothetical protein
MMVFDKTDRFTVAYLNNVHIGKVVFRSKSSYFISGRLSAQKNKK